MDFAPYANWEAIGFLLGWVVVSIVLCFTLEKFGGHKN
jgi:hypothetical protein